jgi:hypothetical protein
VTPALGTRFALGSCDGEFPEEVGMIVFPSSSARDRFGIDLAEAACSAIRHGDATRAVEALRYAMQFAAALAERSIEPAAQEVQSAVEAAISQLGEATACDPELRRRVNIALSTWDEDPSVDEEFQALMYAGHCPAVIYVDDEVPD